MSKINCKIVSPAKEAFIVEPLSYGVDCEIVVLG